MSRKILALDLDGTLTDSNKEITPRTKEMIAKMQEQGHIEVADYVTLSNDEDGVAHVIEKFILAKAN